MKIKCCLMRFAVVLLLYRSLCTVSALATQPFMEPAGLRVIRENAFRNAGYTGTASFYTVEEIESSAFAGTKLDTVVLGKQVQNVGADAFDSVQTAYILGETTQIDSTAFGPQLTTVYYHGTNASVGSLMADRSDVLFIDLSDNQLAEDFIYMVEPDIIYDEATGITRDGALLMRYVGGATEITIPAEIDGYQVGGFDFDFLQSLSEADQIDFETDELFERIDLSFFRDKPGVILTSPGYFTNDGGLYRITNDSRKEASLKTYYGIATAVDIPARCNGYAILSIEGGAFHWSMVSQPFTVTMNEGLKSIGYAAFYAVPVIEIHIPASVTELGYTEGIKNGDLGMEAIYIPRPGSEYNQLKTITVMSGNRRYKSVDGVLLSKDGKTLYHYPPAKQEPSYTVPTGVTTVCAMAFSCASNLKQVSLPASVKQLQLSKDAYLGASRVNWPGHALFEFCESLEAIEVDVGNSVYKSVDGVLYTKNGKQLLRYPDNKPGIAYTTQSGTQVVRRTAFYNNKNLKTVTLSSGVTRVAENAFAKANVQRLICPSSLETILYSDEPSYPGYSVDYNMLELELHSPKQILLNEIQQYDANGMTIRYTVVK